jgi:adenylate kinase family enzyme
MVTKNRYSFSFTGASALISETLVVAEEYIRLGDWQKVKVSVHENNLMSKTKQNTSNRIYNELKKRLEQLTTEQLNLLVDGSPDESKAIILLSLLKTYAFFNDFVIEIIRNKYLLFNNILLESDYSSFFNSKAVTYNELNEITDKTAYKVKQVLFKMLEQVGLINSLKEGIITKPFLSDEVIVSIINDDPSFLVGFLYSDAEINFLTQ